MPVLRGNLPCACVSICECVCVCVHELSIACYFSSIARCVRHFFAVGPEVVWLHAPCGSVADTYTLTSAYGQAYDLHKCPKAQFS